MQIEKRNSEYLNALSHGIGIVLGIAGLTLLLVYRDKEVKYSLFSVLVYGVSIIVLFTASTLYHITFSEKRKHFFRILDHVSIFFLIAGTYTPFSLLSLGNSKGYLMFWIVWGIALLGTIKKIFFTGRFEAFSIALYLMMGWLIVIDFNTLIETVSKPGLIFVIIGGLSYTVGIIFYAIQKIPFNHLIWHVFVLAGAIFHFFSIFLYVV